MKFLTCCKPWLGACLLLCASAWAQPPALSALSGLQQRGIDPSPASLAQYAAQGDLVTLNLLLDAGVAPGAVEPLHRVTALHTAAAQGQVRVVERLLALGVDLNAQDMRGVTPLVAAVSAGHLPVVRLLLRAGARPDVVPTEAPTALVLAAQAGQVPIVRELLAAGADPLRADAFGVTPLDAARRAQRANVLPLLPTAAPPGPTVLPTVLRYPAAESGAPLPRPVPPQSVFHSDAAADAEAARILAAWQVEPVTVPWTRVQLDRHIKHKMMPTRAARGLALVHVAMHDALVLAAARGLDARQAVSMAAAQVLAYLFVTEERAFDRIVWRIAARQSGRADGLLSDAQQHSLALGDAVGKAVVKYAESDGAQKGWNGVRLQYYGENRYHGPGTWEPTPPYFYYPPDEPFAPGWRLWVLKSADEFRPTPPAFGSARFVADAQEVVKIGRELTPEQLRIARFWVDGHGSVTPPGHWNNIAIDKALAAKLDNVRTARLFMQMNIALADTFIAVWDTKYHYWTMRPVTAARDVLGQEFRPAVLTPPFPSYVSGHAGFSGAAARIIGAFVPGSAKAVDAMAEEAAHSRLLGGIHYRHDNEDGLALGRKVALRVLDTFAQRQSP